MDSETPEPLDRPTHEQRRVASILGRMDLGVGQASVVVDANECDFVACTFSLSASIAVDAMPYGLDASQLLRVDMKQITGCGVLVPKRWISLFLESPDPADALSLQMLRDSRDGNAHLACDLPGCFASPSKLDHPPNQFARRQPRQPFRSAASIFQALNAAFIEAIQPLMGRLAAHACGASRLGHGPVLFMNSTDEKKTRLRRKLGVRMELHLGFLSAEKDWFRNPISSDRTSGVNNVYGSHT